METYKFQTIAKIYNDFQTKFGIPRQSTLLSNFYSTIVFEKKFRAKNMFIVKNMGHRLSEKDIKFVKPIIKEVLAKKDLFNLY